MRGKERHYTELLDIQIRKLSSSLPFDRVLQGGLQMFRQIAHCGLDFMLYCTFLCPHELNYTSGKKH